MMTRPFALEDPGLRLTRNELAILSQCLDQVLDLPAGERLSWLGRLAEPFPGARALLRQMLDNEAAGVPNVLPSLPTLGTMTEAAERAQGEVPWAPGTCLGHYVLVHMIGEGGMSTVWRARRTDQLKDRPVAIKVPHLHLPKAGRFVERFQRERDILARLAHPHIAHLYDAGVGPTGQPYLVMEFVEGEALGQYCHRHQLPITDRIKLFLQVLEAASFAHQKGVIHRDIKPSNILVRPGGLAVLLDFGIAKLLTEDQAEETELTVHGGAVLTLNYASPEQLRGEALGPPTDIYSLGVVLYELLCGRRPYEPDANTAPSRQSLVRAIMAGDPVRPSVVALREGLQTGSESTPPRVSRVLRGDLDTITLKALRVEPGERYASCDAFADDLRRYLRGDAVRARGDSRGYRWRRWIRRERPTLMSAGGGTLALLALAALWIDTRHRAVLPVESRPSLAVLPFDNISGDAGNDYLTQGIQDEVLTHMASISGLKVLSRRATAGFENKPGRIQAVKRALSVGNVLEGSVQKQGDRVLVDVQLIETAGETHLWAESFDRPVQALFDVEREIAESVAARLQARLLPAERTAVSAVDTQNVEAHTADLWGKFYLKKLDFGSLQKAVGYFNDAIRLDPRYAMALADLSTAAFYLASSLDGSEARAAQELARDSAQRALKISPNLAEAHSALGWVLLYFDWDVRGAERELSGAARLSPNSLRAKAGLANLYATLGELQRAIDTMNEARLLDPLSGTVSASLSNYALGLEHWDEAANWCRKVLELDASAQGCHVNLAIVALAQGDSATAAREAELEPAENWKEYAQALVRQRDANRVIADQALKDYIQRHQEDSPYWIASLYAVRDDAAAAFLWLERARQSRDVGTIEFLQSPFFLKYRNDPRYRAFREAMGLARVPSDGN